MQIDIDESNVYCDSGDCEVFIFIPVYANNRCPCCEQVGTPVGEQ